MSDEFPIQTVVINHREIRLLEEGELKDRKYLDEGISHLLASGKMRAWWGDVADFNLVLSDLELTALGGKLLICVGEDTSNFNVDKNTLAGLTLLSVDLSGCVKLKSIGHMMFKQCQECGPSRRVEDRGQ